MGGIYLVMRVSGGQIFNPGPVSAKSAPGVVIQDFESHADFENTCNLCHQPIERNMAEACMRCHKNVEKQIVEKTGTHGNLDGVMNCAGCHAEHKGRDFDPVKTALLNFDHNKTSFRLVDQHARAVCEDCHQNNRYDQADPKCVSCHSEPKTHAGMFGLDCASCHTASGWQPALVKTKPFDHEITAFSLALHRKNYSGAEILCAGCHRQDLSASLDQSACTACHANQDGEFMQQHIAQYGENCIQCHDGKDRMRGFKHDQVFVLDGKHAILECESCHAENVFHATPSACSACHGEPEIHAGAFGLKCQYCHATDAWNPALLKVHGFPIDHGSSAETDCKTCHTGSYAVYTCYTCHEHEEGEIKSSHSKLVLSDEKLADCAACHMDGKVDQ